VSFAERYRYFDEAWIRWQHRSAAEAMRYLDLAVKVPIFPLREVAANPASLLFRAPLSPVHFVLSPARQAWKTL
jgi:hypothetical protein